MTNKRLRHITDVLLTLLLLCLMAYQATGEAVHEWSGVAMTALLVLHHVLNRRRYGTLFKGRYGARRVLSAIVNALLLISVLLTAACGMSVSSRAVPFLHGLLPIHFAQRFHLTMSFWSFVLMGFHLGLHLPVLAGRERMSGRAKRAIVGAAVLAAAAGAWLFIKDGIPGYLFFRVPFAMFDDTKSLLRVLLENLAMLVLFAAVGAACASVTGSNKRGNAGRNGQASGTIGR